MQREENKKLGRTTSSRTCVCVAVASKSKRRPPIYAPSPFPTESVTIMSSAATASSLTASPGSCRGVITRRSSTFHPIKRTLLRVPSHSKNQLHQNWVARRAATVVTRASPRDGEDTEAAPPTSPGFSSSRRNIINGAFFAVSLPLWRDIAHDLGYLHGKEVVFLHFFSHSHTARQSRPRHPAYVPLS